MAADIAIALSNALIAFCMVTLLALLLKIAGDRVFAALAFAFASNFKMELFDLGDKVARGPSDSSA